MKTNYTGGITPSTLIVKFNLIYALYNATVKFRTAFLYGLRGGAVVRASDFGPRGPWFEPRPVHISLWP